MIQINASLPLPSEQALTTSDQLVSLIKSLIGKQRGSLRFDQYMQACLYAPGLGYYSAGSQKFGCGGDFITAPEISSLFSKCLAVQCADALQHMAHGIIFELGAGSGQMACDVLRQLDKLGQLPEEYWILEVSADLRKRQQQLLLSALPKLSQRVQWLDRIPENTFNGVILANEVIDALPVRRFCKHKKKIEELGVGLNHGHFTWTRFKADDVLFDAANQIEKSYGVFPEGYISEINLNLSIWLASFFQHMESGAMFIIDYGYSAADYYHSAHCNGTLSCYYQHRVHHDPFFYPGLQDVTSAVNFTALAQSASQTGIQVSGYTTQAYFLMACGMGQWVVDIDNMDIKSRTILSKQLKMLAMPDQMGDKFKFMALTKNLDHQLLAFSIMDQRVRL